MKWHFVHEKCFSVLPCEHNRELEDNGKIVVEWAEVKQKFYRAKEILGAHYADLSPIERKLYEELDAAVK